MKLVSESRLRIRNAFETSLYRNSFFLLLAYFSDAVLAFAFWAISANLYPKEYVGIATGAISLLFLTVTLSRVGLDQSLIRHFPDGDKGAILSTCLAVTTLLALLMGIGSAILGVNWSFSTVNNEGFVLWFLVFVSAESAVSITSTAFIAVRRADLFWIQRLIADSKILLLFVFRDLGVMGIVISFGIPLFAAIAFAVATLRVVLGIRLGRVNLGFLKSSSKFAAGNYVSAILLASPAQIVPLIILGTVGAEATASYYIAYGIGSVLFFVPGAFSTSLFVEGSHGEHLS